MTPIAVWPEGVSVASSVEILHAGVPGLIAGREALGAKDHVACLTAVLRACELGLGLEEQVAAVVLLTDAVRHAVEESGPDGQPFSGDDAVRHVERVRRLGLLDVVALVPSEVMAPACAALDMLVVIALDSGGIDDESATQIADEAIETLPFLPLLTAVDRLWRGQGVTKGELLARRLAAEAGHAPALASAIRYKFINVPVHNRQRLGGSDRLSELDELDRELDASFGELYACGATSTTGAVVGALVGMFSSAKREEDNARRNAHAAAQGRVLARSGFFGRDPYVKAYAAFLNGRIDAAHAFIDAAITAYRSSLDQGFDPSKAVLHLAWTLRFRNRQPEALKLLEHWLPRLTSAAQRKAKCDADEDNDSSGEDDGAGASLLSEYVQCGGQIAMLPDLATLPDVVEQARANAASIPARATAIAAKASGRRREILESWSQKGLSVVDAALGPEAYDAALSGTGGDALVRLPPGAFVGAPDESPLFREVGLEPFVRLIGMGLPARALATFGVALAEAAESRWRLDSRALERLCPKIFLSPRWIDRRLRGLLERRELSAAGEELVRAAERRVLDEAAILSAFEALATQHEAPRGDRLTFAMLGESLVQHLPMSGRAREGVSLRAANALGALAEAAGLGERVRLLERAVALAPKQADLVTRLGQARSARLKRVTSTVVVVLLVVAGVFAWLYWGR